MFNSTPMDRVSFVINGPHFQVQEFKFSSNRLPTIMIKIGINYCVLLNVKLRVTAHYNSRGKKLPIDNLILVLKYIKPNCDVVVIIDAFNCHLDLDDHNGYANVVKCLTVAVETTENGLRLVHFRDKNQLLPRHKKVQRHSS